MIHRDFLMRQIQQMTQALATVLTRQRQGQTEEALQEIDRAFRQAVAGEYTPPDALPVDELIAACSTSEGFVAEKGLAVADLLAAQGDARADRDDAEGACASRVRALALYLEATRSDILRLDLYDRIDQLEAQTEECDRPASVQQRL